MIRFSSLAAATVASLVLAAPAAAAPDHTAKFGDVNGTKTWQSAVNVGVAPTAQIAETLGCDTRMCDDMLVEVTEIGKLTAAVRADQESLVDIDLYVFRSNAAGEALTELGRITEFDADESLAFAKLQPGFYLVRTDWSLGAGSFTGNLTWKPDPKPPVS